MKNKKYSILYSSLTGNTKVLADAIHEALPQDECEYFGVSDTVIPSSELLYIGFWTDKGNADTKTLQLLSQLKNKQIFLFGTAGFGGSDVYFRKILNQVKQFVDASNVIVGEYMCQGRNYIGIASHMVYFPGLIIFITVLAFNLFGDGLRDTLDPKIK